MRKLSVGAIATCVLAMSFAMTSAVTSAHAAANTRHAFALGKNRVALKPIKRVESQQLRFRRSENIKALNPQPLPPHPDAGRLNATQMRMKAMQTKALNPQPLPPHPDTARRVNAMQPQVKMMENRVRSINSTILGR